MKKLIALLLVLLVAFSLAAEEKSLLANDLEPAQLVSTLEIDGFKILGTSSKPIDIQEMDERTAPDGEIFNIRIKLNGTGKKDLLAVGFTAKKGQKVTIYLNSSSKTDERVLNLYTPNDVTPILTLPAPPATSDMTVGMGTLTIPYDGEFLVGSAKSGIYIYGIIIE